MFLSNGSITAQRYLRLMALATMEILCTIPIATYGTYLNLTLYEVQPWISWSDTHFNYSHVNLYPSILWRMDRIGTVSLELSRSLPVFCALIFFCFFGFADEARRNYRKAYFAVISLFKPVRGFRIFRFRSQEYVNIVFYWFHVSDNADNRSTLPFDNSLPSTSPTSSSWSIPKCREFSLSPKAEHFPFSRDRGVSKSNFSPTSSCFAWLLVCVCMYLPIRSQLCRRHYSLHNEWFPSNDGLQQVDGSSINIVSIIFTVC